MNRIPSLLALTFGLATCALVACVGTSTGNPIQDTDAGKHTPDGGTLTNGGEGGLLTSCDATTSTLATNDTKSPLGFSAADILSLVAGDHTVSMEWLGESDLTITPAPGKSMLHIGVTAKSAKPRFVQLDPKAGGAGGGTGIYQPAGDSCPDHVEIDVHVTLHSDDGGLAEAFDTTLSAENEKLISLSHTIAAKDLAGSFTAAGTGPLGVFTLQSVAIETSFSQLGISGSLSPALVSESNSSTGTGAGGVSRAGGGVARWPAGDACDPFTNFGTRGVPRAIGDAFGDASMADAIALVNKASALTLTWQGAPAASLKVAFTPAGASACASYGNSLDGSTQAGVQLSILGKLAAKTGDGRIDAHWPLSLTAYYDANDKLSHVDVATDPNGGIVVGLVSASDFTRAYGITGVDVSAYDQANALIGVSWTTGSTASATGSLTVQGATVPMCASEKPAPTPPVDAGAGSAASGTPGCQGIDLHTLETATIASK